MGSGHVESAKFMPPVHGPTGSSQSKEITFQSLELAMYDLPFHKSSTKRLDCPAVRKNASQGLSSLNSFFDDTLERGIREVLRLFPSSLKLGSGFWFFGLSASSNPTYWHF